MSLEDPGTIVVVGGGPAGAFFSIRYLKGAKSLGRNPNLIIIEKKYDRPAPNAKVFCPFAEDCNYCAGGISPKLAETLERNEMDLPAEIISGRIQSLTVHAHWKNIELRVPENKKMYAVFRGSRPKARENKHKNFDSFLLEKAREAGARIIPGEVVGVGYSSQGKPEVTFAPAREKIEADFVVFAGGVNQTIGKPFEQNPFIPIIQSLIPDFKPPKVRRGLICEIEIGNSSPESFKGEIYFVEYGSKQIKIEMSSLIPKGKYITAVLLGKSIDRAAGHSDEMDILLKYLELPQIQRILPKTPKKNPLCVCSPYMTVGAARKPFGDRAAVIGDMAVSRLYKDGIYSAYITAASLAEALMNSGSGTKSLKRHFWPTVKRIRSDNSYGQIVFWLNHVVFSRPALSRILYQGVLTERKNKPRQSRTLADILWKIASGDDTYKKSLMSMFDPRTIYSIAVGGFLVTFRNFLAERFFGLNWRGFGRYPTGLHREDFEEKKKYLLRIVENKSVMETPEFESMYSIAIKTGREKILRFLGTFGDEDRKYFRPRLIKVRRIAGNPNEPGSLIQYQTPVAFLNFHVALEKTIEKESLIYRVTDGFAKEGLMVFNIEEISPHNSLLFIYVAFNFRRGEKLTEKLFWWVVRLLFPGYVHDVLWNHSLCELKEIVEKE